MSCDTSRPRSRVSFLLTKNRITEKCTLCSWKEAKGTATEDKFECTTSESVQMAIELRSAHNIKTGICETCEKKSVAKVMQEQQKVD